MEHKKNLKQNKNAKLEKKKCGDGVPGGCGNQVATRKDQYLNITDISRPDID